MKRLWRLLFHPEALIVTVLIFTFIYLFWFLFLHLHFLNPLNYGFRDYEETDIVYSQLRDPNKVEYIEEIVLINSGAFVDRARLAEVLNRVQALEPAVAGIDIFFTEKKDPYTDSLLRGALQSIPKVVMPGMLTAYNPQTDLFAPMDYCHPYFCEGRPVGYTNFVSQDTSTIRYFSPREKTVAGEARSFTVELAEAYAPGSTQKLWKRGKKVENIYYSGNQRSFLKFEQEQLLDSATFEAIRQKGVFRNKIVLIGYVGNHQPGEADLDRHFTPLNRRYTGKTLPDMYGLEIQANILTMILRDRYIHSFPRWLMELLGWLYCYLNVIIILKIYRNLSAIYHGVTRLMQVVEFMLIFVVVALLFYYFRIQVDFTNGILSMALAYDFVMVYEGVIKKRLPYFKNH